jgi:hypothetical protein
MKETDRTEQSELRLRTARYEVCDRVRDEVRRMSPGQDMLALVACSPDELAISFRSCAINLVDSRENPQAATAHSIESDSSSKTVQPHKPCDGVLKKPYSMVEASAAIRQVLDSKKQSDR